MKFRSFFGGRVKSQNLWRSGNMKILINIVMSSPNSQKTKCIISRTGTRLSRINIKEIIQCRSFFIYLQNSSFTPPTLICLRSSRLISYWLKEPSSKLIFLGFCSIIIHRIISVVSRTKYFISKHNEIINAMSNFTKSNWHNMVYKYN